MAVTKRQSYELRKARLNTIELYQEGKKFIFVTDIDKLAAMFELRTGLIFKYEVAKGYNYFYNFWLEKPSYNRIN